MKKAGAWLYRHLGGSSHAESDDDGCSFVIRTVVIHIFDHQICQLMSVESKAAPAGSKLQQQQQQPPALHNRTRNAAAGKAKGGTGRRSEKRAACPSSLELLVVRDAVTAALADLKLQTAGVFGLSKVRS